MKVAVLGGGPDAERAVSLDSSAAVAQAIHASDRFTAAHVIIDRPESLTLIDADAFFPVLHGPWGEGGPLQDLLAGDGRPFVGSMPRAARLAMDKLAAKLAAASVGLRTPAACLINSPDAGVGIAPPAVIKPVHEGSSIGLHIAQDEAALSRALDAAHAGPAGVHWMAERLVPGREITCGLIDRGEGLEPLPIVEIIPGTGVYDYDAKYQRRDTRYVVRPDLDAEFIQGLALAAANAIGIRHLARADFMLDPAGVPWFLEINTMPGFTANSLVPKAAADAGLDLRSLCEALLDAALRDHSSRESHGAEN